MTTEFTDPFEGEASLVPLKIAGGLARISLAIRHHNWKSAGERGLTPTQGQVLAFLGSRNGALCRLTEVVVGLALTPATVSEAVRVLTEKGHVEKARHANDGRSVELKLTDSGQREADNAILWLDFLSSAAVVLDAREQGAFLRTIIKIIHELQRRDEIPQQRMCVTCKHFRARIHRDSPRPHHCKFYDGSMGDNELRIDCLHHERADTDLLTRNSNEFMHSDAST